jgi:hypothetical protein
VAQRRVRVEHYTRGRDDTWVLREHGPGSRLQLESIAGEIAIDEIWLELAGVGSDWAASQSTRRLTTHVVPTVTAVAPINLGMGSFGEWRSATQNTHLRFGLMKGKILDVEPPTKGRPFRVGNHLI